MTAPPSTSTEHWDTIAAKVKKANGRFVIVIDAAPKVHNRSIRENFERRGMKVEVTSRLGLGPTSETRPWDGWRTWCREVKS